MSKHIFLCVIILISSYNIFSQTYTVSGYITDAETGEHIAGAYITDKKLTAVAVTNNYGFYNLSIPAKDSLLVRVSYIGYKSITKRIDLKNDLTINFALKTCNDIEEVIINADGKNNFFEGISTLNIPIKKIKELPQVLGEADLFKAWQLLPSVQLGDEAKGNLYVRGGSFDQNLILLDDVPMYYVNHLGGFYSTFNIDAISSGKLYVGGFPAKFGDRLSSISDIRMKEGSLKKFKGNINIGLLASGLSFQGPVIKDKTSYIVSARTSYFPLLSYVFKLGFDYNFYDLNAKLNHKFSDKDRLFMSFYKGKDKFEVNYGESDNENDEVSSKISWGNDLFALRWNRLFSNKFFTNSTFFYTAYSYNNDFSKKITADSISLNILNSNKTNIQDFGFKTDAEFHFNNNHSCTFGLKTTRHQFSPFDYHFSQNGTGIIKIDTNINVSNQISLESALYYEQNITFNSILKLNMGLRAMHYFINSDSKLFIEPRIRMVFKPVKSFSGNASFTRVSQNIHFLSSSGIGMQSDFWLPSTENIPFERADIYVLGFNKSFNKNFTVSLESWYKKSDNLVTLIPGSNILHSKGDFESLVYKGGNGKAYGIELMVEKTGKKYQSWISCSYSNSVRQFSDFNNGDVYPFDYDRPIKTNIVFMYEFKDNLKFSLTWIYASGRPYSMPIAVYDSYENKGYDDFIFAYGGINNARMENYHRLDIGLVYENQLRYGKSVWNFSIFNVYNRKNPYFYYIEYNESEQLELIKEHLFPIMPSINYSFAF